MDLLRPFVLANAIGPARQGAQVELKVAPLCNGCPYSEKRGQPSRWRPGLPRLGNLHHAGALCEEECPGESHDKQL